MQVLFFELCDGTYALKLDAVERILAPGEAAPPGRRTVDLAQLLEMTLPVNPHVVLLARRDLAIAIGRPVGAVRIDPAWILPLPGYMFRVGRAPFRGLIDIPAGSGPGMPAEIYSRTGLLLDEEKLAEMTR